MFPISHPRFRSLGAVPGSVRPLGAGVLPAHVPSRPWQHGVPHDPERHHDGPLLQLLLPRVRQEEAGVVHIPHPTAVPVTLNPNRPAGLADLRWKLILSLK